MATGRTHRPATRSRGIPEATVARLPLYLRALTALSERSVPTVSSEELAAAAGVNSAKLRKDFSYLGSYGTRGVGYDVEYLVYQISRELGLTQDWPVVIVGIGNLGAALANYGGFASRGFRVAALIDADPAMAGKPVAGIPVQHTDDLERIIKDNGVSIGVIATPAGAAQQVCDRLVAAGVTSILNFAPTVLSVPEGVDVRKVDLSIELQILAFHEQRKAGEDAGAVPAAGQAVPSPAASAPAGAAAAAVPGAPAAAPLSAAAAAAADDDAVAAARKGRPEGDVPAVMPA
ncbi:redox-sensing transcriptional repressor Rex [Streptomyces antimicrobicus]|uniref:Redox-sensing transcriptional repressor Rex n=1 Tax=Streptomyces antimicrobicus TaxID=2883108 RepID=A0ABS8BEG6_9ACTN|nr:redox-sensing transcriptional repressor Rex [Streptomyces antimicrobicus]MCB5183028.1 redox-sensing transcriptional repressor Rex [Streptomyces antimicrobicus]